METVSGMGVFNEIFNACKDIETLYGDKSKNPLKNLFANRNIKKAYNNIYRQIDLINDNAIVPEMLLDGYLDCLGSTRSSFGTCKKIMKNGDVYVATFEFEFVSTNTMNMSAVVDVAQIKIPNYVHYISTTFHIISKESEVHKFNIKYTDLISRREDEVNLSDEEKAVKRTQDLAKETFVIKLRQDIYAFLKDFVDSSKERLERKRGADGESS